MPPTKAKSASRSADADDGANAIGDDFTKKLIPRELELQITEGRARLMRDLERLNATTGKLDATRNNTVTFLRTVSNVKEQEIDSFLVKPNVGSIDTSAAKTLIAWLGCEIISIKSDSARVQIYVSTTRVGEPDKCRMHTTSDHGYLGCGVRRICHLLSGERRALTKEVTSK